MFKQLCYRLLFHLGNPKSQITSLSHKITINARLHPNFHYYCSAIYTYLGHCYTKRNQKEQAAIAYSKAIFQDHDNQYAIPKRFAQTRQYLVKLDQSAQYIFLNQAITHFYLKEYNLCLKILMQTIDIAIKEHNHYHRQSSKLYYHRAYLYYLKKNYDFSVIDLTKALDLNADNCDALSLRAQLYVKRKNYNGAIEDYNRILTIKPNARTAKSDLSIIYRKLNILLP